MEIHGFGQAVGIEDQNVAGAQVQEALVVLLVGQDAEGCTADLEGLEAAVAKQEGRVVAGVAIGEAPGVGGDHAVEDGGELAAEGVAVEVAVGVGHDLVEIVDALGIGAQG